MALYTVPGLPVSIEAPDGINEDQVNSLRADATQRYLGEVEQSAKATPNGWVSAAARLLSGGGFNGMPGVNAAPKPAMAKINPKDFIGMTAEQSNATLGRIQQNDNDALRAYLAQKAQVQQGIEREKDRQQQIKLESSRFKNDVAMQQHQEAMAQEAERRAAKQAEINAKMQSQIRMDEAKAKEDLPSVKAETAYRTAAAERQQNMPIGRSSTTGISLQDVNGVPSWIDKNTGSITPANVPPDPKQMREFVDAQFKDIDATARKNGLIKKDPFKNDSVPDKAKYDQFVSDYIHGILSSPNTTDDEWATLMHSPKLKSLGINVTEDDAGIHVKYPDGRSATFTNESPFGEWDEAQVSEAATAPGALVDVGFWNGMQIKQDPKTGEYYSIGLK